MTDVDEIKRRLNIVDVIGDYVKLQKSGANWRARCPFHAEKTPSFFVSPDRQIWHCFGGCSKGGDMFRFLMEIEGVEFAEALRILAGRAGVELTRFNKQAHNEKSAIFRINEVAAAFFQKALENTEGGAKAQGYLKKRGVNEESIERFSIGWAPSSWRALLAFLEKKGCSKEDALKTGLAVKNDEGRVYDRFRARIMFPIQNLAGLVTGFTGRVLDDQAKEAKYINTPQTLVYDKSQALYGIYQAKQAIKRSDEAIFVEGNLDVILSSQAGVENVVATSGTALTQSHLDAIRRYTRNITFCFDSDQAGESASRRAFEMALRGNFNIQTLLLTREKDPAELIAKKGAKEWSALASKKTHIMEFLWEQALNIHDPESIKGKKAIAQEYFHFLSLTPHRIEQGHWLKELAKRLGAREDDVVQEFQKFETVDKGHSKNYNQYEENKDVSRSDRRSRIERDRENLGALLALYPHFAKEAGRIMSMSKGSEKEALTLSGEELSLKAQIFWPTENLARRELERILNHLEFIKKKDAVVASAKGKPQSAKLQRKT